MFNTNTRQILMESRQSMKKIHKLDLTNLTDYKNMLVNDSAFETYKASHMESVAPRNVEALDKMVDNTRLKLLESINTVSQLSPYETLAMPILFAFYPRLVAKELVTIRNINKPDVLMPFMNYDFVKPDGTVIGRAPYMNNISFGPSVSMLDNKSVSLGQTDVLADNSLTSDVTSVERTMAFYKVTATIGGTSESVNVAIKPTIDGNFHANVDMPTTGTLVVSGIIDFEHGIVDLSAFEVGGAPVTVCKLFYTASFSLEQNVLNARVKPTIEKIRLIVEDQEVSADWTIQLEQDFSALFDVDIQSQIIDILGKQMALDLDNKILGHIFQVANGLASSHQLTFDRTPASGYTLGPVYWYENILEKLTKLSAQIYTDTNIGEGNVLAANPIDAAIFESLNKFSFDGKGADGGSIGYNTGSLAQRWKIFSTPIVPQGKMLMMHKPTDILQSIYVFAPYQPAVMSPYPLGNTPSLTILSRNARNFYRPEGSAILNIITS